MISSQRHSRQKQPICPNISSIYVLQSFETGYTLAQHAFLILYIFNFLPFIVYCHTVHIFDCISHLFYIFIFLHTIRPSHIHILNRSCLYISNTKHILYILHSKKTKKKNQKLTQIQSLAHVGIWVGINAVLYQVPHLRRMTNTKTIMNMTLKMVVRPLMKGRVGRGRRGFRLLVWLVRSRRGR